MSIKIERHPNKRVRISPWLTLRPSHTWILKSWKDSQQNRGLSHDFIWNGGGAMSCDSVALSYKGKELYTEDISQWIHPPIYICEYEHLSLKEGWNRSRCWDSVNAQRWIQVLFKSDWFSFPVFEKSCSFSQIPIGPSRLGITSRLRDVSDLIYYTFCSYLHSFLLHPPKCNNARKHTPTRSQVRFASSGTLSLGEWLHRVPLFFLHRNY